ncbi:MAG: hypothetical protein V3T39_08870 [Gammaproteobacteria bacterium]
MAKHLAAKGRDMRTRLAIEAAKLIAEEGIKDFLIAKRKAAERLGVAEHTSSFPNNLEIEASLIEYQRLFKSGTAGLRLRALREAAKQAMLLFEDFYPRLVGSVLSGNATEFSDVELHLFDDAPEKVAMHLMSREIPYQSGERRVRQSGGEFQRIPLFGFIAGDIGIETVVFPYKDMHCAPACPVNGKPMRRASLEELELLLLAEA